MTEYWPLLIGVGILSGFLNVSAGGGSTLTLPLLIFMGLDGTLANGTNRVAILIQNISSVTTFQKSRGYRTALSVKQSLWTIPGAIAGSFFATNISDEVFRTVLGVIIIGVIVTLIVPRRLLWTERRTENRRESALIYPALLFIGFYGGFIQVGVGFLFMAALYHLMKYDLVTVNMQKVFIVLLYTIPALCIFAMSGDVDWIIGLTLAAGSATGGWIAARVSLKHGEPVIRIALVAALLLMSLKLLNVF